MNLGELNHSQCVSIIRDRGRRDLHKAVCNRKREKEKSRFTKDQRLTKSLHIETSFVETKHRRSRIENVQDLALCYMEKSGQYLMAVFASNNSLNNGNGKKEKPFAGMSNGKAVK